MGQKDYWSYFAFSQIQLVEGKIVPEVLLPHEAKQTQLFWHFQSSTSNCLFGIRGIALLGVILPLKESHCLD